MDTSAAPGSGVGVAVDLVILTLHEGRLSVARAWSDGRVRVRASMRDMLRLRAALA